MIPIPPTPWTLFDLAKRLESTHGSPEFFLVAAKISHVLRVFEVKSRSEPSGFDEPWFDDLLLVKEAWEEFQANPSKAAEEEIESAIRLLRSTLSEEGEDTHATRSQIELLRIEIAELKAIIEDLTTETF